LRAAKPIEAPRLASLRDAMTIAEKIGDDDADAP
jgi:hypothetical protein